jgi:N-acetylglutamate synthase
VIAADRLFAALEATWPAAARFDCGPFVIREGAGGGKRVSAATAAGPVTASDIVQAEAAMRALGQVPVFMVRGGEGSLDALLAASGHALADPTLILGAPLAALDLPKPPRLAAIPAWPPLAIQSEIWAAGGVGPARIAVMARAAEPRTTILGRMDDRAAGTAFVAVHDGIAMVHAVEVHPRFRRRGVARQMMAGALHWARGAGATDLAVLVTEANGAARALYASIGLVRVGQYHYRIAQGEAAP